MWNWRKITQSPFLTQGLDGRKSPRYPSPQVSCPLGEVLDLSASGMGVRCEGKPPVEEGQSVAIWLKTGRKKLTLQARVARKTRISRKEVHLGLEFVCLPPGMDRVLEKLARLGFLPTENKGSGASHGSAGPGGIPGGIPGGAPGSGQTSTQGRHAGHTPRIRVGIHLPDHYAAMGLDGDAGEDDIRAAFRKLAAQYHPDVNKSPDAVDRFVAIQQAYEVLRDPRRRREYDALVFGRSLSA